MGHKNQRVWEKTYRGFDNEGASRMRATSQGNGTRGARLEGFASAKKWVGESYVFRDRKGHGFGGGGGGGDRGDESGGGSWAGHILGGGGGEAGRVFLLLVWWTVVVGVGRASIRLRNGEW